MTNFNSTSNFIFGATERELSTLSLREIIDGLMADYKSFSSGTSAGIHIPSGKQEPRMSHSCILFAEGLRQASVHLELAKKLILASLFDSNAGLGNWIAANEDSDMLEKIFRKIVKSEELTLREKLILANTFGFNVRAAKWLADNDEVKHLESLFKLIAEFEAYKAEERRKEEERKLKMLEK